MIESQNEYSSTDERVSFVTNRPVNSNEQIDNAPLAATTRAKRQDERDRHFSSASGHMLDLGDSVIYTVVGICFLIGAITALIYSVWDFVAKMYPAISSGQTSQIASSIIQFVSDLLLVLIIMEVLSTVIHYLKARATSLRPFLFIGIISATRSVLSIGARLSIAGSNIEQGEFNRAMIELGVNAAVVLALGVTLTLIGKHIEIDDSNKN